MQPNSGVCSTPGCTNPAVNPSIGFDICEECNRGQRSRERANPFDPRGRLGRLGFVLTSICIWVAVAVAQFIIGSAGEPGRVGLGVLVAVHAVALYAQVATAIKRSRDAGLTPLTAGGLFLPLLNIVVWLTLAFSKSKPGPEE